MSTSTSLNVRALLKEAVARAGLDAVTPSLSGLNAPAKALHVAALAHTRPKGIVLFVVPTDRDLEQAIRDTRFFMSALDGLSDAASERTVLAYPSHEIDPYRGMTPHVGVTSARARALHAIASGTARIVIASAAALLPRVSTPDRLRNASIELRPGNEIAPMDLGELLTDAGFRREDPADEHGEFAVRGALIDLFPMGSELPYRIDLFDDEIETLRTFDAETQRSIDKVESIRLLPAREFPLDKKAVTDFRARFRERFDLFSSFGFQIGQLRFALCLCIAKRGLPVPLGGE